MEICSRNKKTTFHDRVSQDSAREIELKENERRKRAGHPLAPVLEQTRFILPMKKCPMPNCSEMIKATWLCCDKCRAKMNELKQVHSLSK